MSEQKLCKKCNKDETIFKGISKSNFCEKCWFVEKSKIKEQICGICLSSPPIKPIWLPMCAHVFCYKCNLEWATYNVDQNTRTIRLSCPICRACKIINI